MHRNKLFGPDRNSLLEVLAEITDPQVLGRLLDEIMTPAEIQDLVLRWKLMRRILDGASQRAIALELGISLCKITRGAKILKHTDSLCYRFLTAGESSAPTRPTTRRKP